jgi:hypothetical protein
VQVTVHVEDVNDNAPVFTKPSYECVVGENAAVGLSFFQVSATDADGGASGEVFYSVVATGPTSGSDFVSVDPTAGVLFVTKTLSGRGRRDPHSVTVRATDRGSPPLFSEVSVAVFVADVASNDGVPYISKPASGEIATVAEVSAGLRRGQWAFSRCPQAALHSRTIPLSI